MTRGLPKCERCGCPMFQMQVIEWPETFDKGANQR